jgi:hypothetical protein
MDVEFLIATSAGKPGTKMKAKKDEYGWHGTDKNGKSWSLFPSHLRCSELCRLSNMR